MTIYEKIDKAIENGNVEAAKIFISSILADTKKAEWTANKKAEYDILYPELRQGTESDWTNTEILWSDLTDEDIAEFLVPNEIDITFDEWLAETKTVLVGTEERTDDDGVVYEKEIFEEKLIRPYEPVAPTDDEINNYLISLDSYKSYNNVIKSKQLDELIVTVSTGTRFYCNPISRTDISDAILEAQDMGASDTDVTIWKTPDGFKSVTVAELKEARRLGLEAKAKIIGVSNV